MSVWYLSRMCSVSLATFSSIVSMLSSSSVRAQSRVSETLDWARTLLLLNLEAIDEQTAKETLHILLKYQTDIAKAAKELSVDAVTK